MDEPFPAFFDVNVASPRHAAAPPAWGLWLSELDWAKSFSAPLPHTSLSASDFDLSVATLSPANRFQSNSSKTHQPHGRSSSVSSGARPSCTSRRSDSSASSNSSSSSAGTARSSASSASSYCISSSTSGPSYTDFDSSATSANAAISSLNAYGLLIPSSDSSIQAWRCAYPHCSSRATFTRGCDLRKHYNRHSKHLYCRHPGCPRSETVAAAIAQSCNGPMSVGFSSEKDLERHEAQHNPTIKCEYLDRNGNKCGRVFSRVDNMKDHVKRIHKARR